MNWGDGSKRQAFQVQYTHFPLGYLNEFLVAIGTKLVRSKQVTKTILSQACSIMSKFVRRKKLEAVKINVTTT